MATVFLPTKRKLWTAKIRVLMPDGKVKWKNIPTHCKNEKDALAFATNIEKASGAPLDRARAERLVETLLELSGGTVTINRPSLLAIGNTLFDGREKNIAESTRRKYAAHWKRFQEWAGDRINRAVDRWTEAELTAYYNHLGKKLGSTTANNHLTTLSMVFLRARAAGHIQGNPVELIERAPNDSTEKEIITREEKDKLLKTMRGNDPWRCLTLLGWHTGHRIGDLLRLTKDSMKREGELWLIEFEPQKKRGKGRTVRLPIPDEVASLLAKIGNFQSLNGADNRNGRVSDEFVGWLRRAGIDPLKVKDGKARKIHRKSFHSFRHSMMTRLTSAGVTGEMARLVTDHESAKVAKGYTHAEVQALADALKKVH
jgi:site-specific recombinase XerD